MGLAVAGHAQNVVITGPASPITEGGSGGSINAPFQVSLSSPATAPADVTVSTVAGSAIAGQDFIATTQTLTFPIGSVGPFTVNVPIVGDETYEPGGNETFSLAATTANGGVQTNNASATASIADDDPQPLLSINDATPVTEGNSGTTPMKFTVSLSAPSSQTISVDYTTAADPNAPDASATPGSDFQTTSGTLFISAGATSADITVPIIGDTADETSETFVVNLSNANGALLGQAQGVGTITDDDGPNVTITDASGTEGDGLDFLITLSAASPEAVTVNFATANSSATAGQDYVATSGTLTFLPGESTTQRVTVQTIDDSLSEGTTPEVFTLNLTGASGGVTFNPRSQAIGTIIDNEDVPVITVAPVSKAEGNTGTTLFSFQVRLSTPSTQPVTVRYTTSNGTATSGNDFRSKSGTVTFLPGDVLKSFDIEVITDTVDEPDETFVVTLSSPTNSTFSSGANSLQTTGTIVNDDGPVITFENPSLSASEGQPAINFRVNLSKASNHTVSVRYATAPTTINPATAGVDYTSVSGTLRYAVGETTKVISVPLKNDTVDEQNETFNLVLSNPAGGTLTAADTATGTILDDDSTPSLSVSNFIGNEGNGGSTTFPFVITLSNSSSQTVTVDYATAGITASPDIDYTTTSGTVTFKPGATKQTVNVRVTADLLDEPTETFQLVLSNPVNAALPATAAGLGTIRDDDATPQLSINASSSQVEDSAADTGDTLASIKFTVSLSAASGQDVSFVFQTSSPKVNSGQLRPATAGSDYVSANGQVITIPAGTLSKEIEVFIRNDDLDEYDEYFNVTLSSPVNASFKRATATGIIIDDDDAPDIKIDDPVDDDHTAIEGGQIATFPVTLSEVAGRDVKVFFTISGNGATNQATPLLDLAPLQDQTGKVLLKQNSSFITIPAGSKSSAIFIAALADKLDEAEEGYRVTITRVDPAAVGFAAVADSTATSTIEDRNPNFNRFVSEFGSNDGYESYNVAQNNGTDVTLTGNQFIINNVSQVRSVLFGVISNNIAKAIPANFNVDSDTQITAKVPIGAVSGKIRIVLINGQVLAPTDNQQDRTFFVNAIPKGFSPTRGIPRSTVVVISGTNFDDPNNPVTGVRFNGTASNSNTAGVDPVVFKQNGQTFIRATVPTDATTGPITITTRNGTNYPPSLQNFTIDQASPGSLRFLEASGDSVFENEQGILKNPLQPKPVDTFTLHLNPAVQSDPAGTQVAPRGDVTVLVTINAGDVGGRVRAPQISVPTGRVRQLSGTRFEVIFDAGSLADKTINVIDAGDDDIKPAFTNTAFQAQTPIVLTLTASIIRSADQANYPVGVAATDLTLNRFDLHGLDTDYGTTLRTTEDQNSSGNITHFRLNLRNINNGVDVAADGTPVQTRKYTKSPQPPVINPDGTVNQDAEPTSDVLLRYNVSDTTEALVRYYVQIPDASASGGVRKVYPNNDAVFRDFVDVIYATDPARDEYYKYDHFIEVKGVDDFIQDGSQQYQLTLDQNNSTSADDEFLNLNLLAPFTLTNADNEQSTGGGEPGFVFQSSASVNGAPLLTTNEAGSTDFFRVNLRTAPVNNGKVVLRLQTSNPAEVLLVDPTDTSGNTKVQSLDVVFYADITGRTLAKNETKWDTPITVRVSGVDDLDLDGTQRVTILTSTAENAAGTLTTDPTYQTIDPIDPLVDNLDDESKGITVSPRNLVINEGATGTFSVRINTRPTSAVTVNLSSNDPTIAAVTPTTLTFTPDNWTAAQSVTVRGVADNAFTPQRNTTIVLSNASSSDTNFDNLDVPDVTVVVQNQTQAFLVEPASVLTAGVTTSEDGGSATFTVRLSNAPTANVLLTLTTSSGEATLSSGASRGSSIVLTFTPDNFSRTQTVTVTGLDDETADGTVAYNINGTVQSGDIVYANQTFPSIPGVNLDNDGTSTNNGITYAANGTYTVSFPYATTASASATLTQAQAFSNASGSGTPQFTLYKFNVTGQRNSRALNGGSDFVVVPASEKLQRGIGYRLVTGANDIVLNQPSGTLKAYIGTSFSNTLSWNPNFLADTSSTDNRNNGYNFIGFPFDPAMYNRVAFSSSQVTYGNETYETITDAAAAGVIDQQLYTVDAQGNLTPSSDLNIRPYRAYFVRILRNDQPVTLKLRNPSK